VRRGVSSEGEIFTGTGRLFAGHKGLRLGFTSDPFAPIIVNNWVGNLALFFV